MRKRCAFWVSLGLTAAVALDPRGVVAQEPAPDDEVSRLAAQASAQTKGGAEGLRAAAETYRRALELLGADAPEREAALRVQLGLVLVELEDLPPSIVEYERALALYRAVGDAAREARVLSHLGYAAFLADDEPRAIEVLTAQIELAQTLGDAGLEAEGESDRANVYRFERRYQEALDGYRRSLEILRPTPDRFAEASVLASLGGLYSTLGETARSLDMSRRALAIFRELGRKREQTVVLANVGHRLVELNRAEEALPYYREQLALLEEVMGADDPRRARALWSLGHAFVALGRADEAIALYERAHALEAGRNDATREAAYRQYLGLAFAAKGESERARVELERALELGAEAGDPGARAARLEALARVRRDLGDLAGAIEAAEEALAIQEELRKEVLSGDLRASYLARARSGYELALDILERAHRRDPAAGHARAAWRISERSRARTLGEQLAARATVESSAGQVAAERRAAGIAAGLSDLQRRMRFARDAGDARAAAGLAAELERLEDARAVAEEERWRLLRAEAPGSFEPVDERRLGALLGPRAALVEYFLGEASSFAFVVAGERLELVRLPPAAEVRQQLEPAFAWLRSPGVRARARGEAALRRLYELLVSPLEAWLAETGALVVVPDGPLHALPFDALIAPSVRSSGPGGSGRPTPFLVRRWSVRSAPSATILAGLAEGAPGAPAGTAVAFVDPEYGAAAAVGPARDLVRGAFGEAAWPLARLPASKGEAAAIAELFGASAAVFAGRDASEERFKSSPEVATARYLHVAAHGLVSEEFPHLSGLALALRAEGSEDGLLQAHEIAKLRLDADLVVLSACQTGLGREVRGEGLVGLSQAFFQAGARGLVVSLWNVADRSTAGLMRAFYRRLAAGTRAAEALRGAQLEQLDGGNAHPYYWAPFVVVGAD